MADNNKQIINRINKPHRLFSFMFSCFGGMTVYSIYDLIRFFYTGSSLRESTLALIATFGIAAMICYLVIDKTITEIKKLIIDRAYCCTLAGHF
jgi:hypothetical protein